MKPVFLLFLVASTFGWPAGGIGGLGDDDASQISYSVSASKSDDLMVDCLRPVMKRTFPDVDYAFYGYNVMRGYPLTSGRDPGYTHKLFEAVYGDLEYYRQTSDCRFMQPLGWDFVPAVTCSTSFTSQKISSTEEFKSSFSEEASVSGGGWGASFSASEKYQEEKETSHSSESLTIRSSARCLYSHGVLDQLAPPPLVDTARFWLKNMHSNHVKGKDVTSEMRDFIEYFGTHIISNIKLGARYSYIFSMTSESYSEMESSGMDVSAAAGYSGFGFSIGAEFSMSDKQQRQSSAFNENVETFTTSVGSAIPADGDAMTWASTVKENPVPMGIHLIDVTHILKPHYFGEELEQSFIDKFQGVLDGYCEYLKSQGQVEDDEKC